MTYPLTKPAWEQVLSYLEGMVRAREQFGDHWPHGPFGAAVLDAQYRVIGLGFNTVVASGDPTNHAEVNAIHAASRHLGDYTRLRGKYLLTSCEPCQMCLGAVTMSGFTKLFIGSPEATAIKVGFDEGDKRLEWEADLWRRGCEVLWEREVRERCDAVLHAYTGVRYTP